MDAKAYFFYDWLIVHKGITEKDLRCLPAVELNQLDKEYQEFKAKLRGEYFETKQAAKAQP